MKRPDVSWSVPILLAGFIAGCGSYTSDYVPPNDGRARAVWKDDRVVASLPVGADTSECNTALDEVQGDPRVYRTYYGGPSRVVVWRPWIIVTSSSSGSRVGGGSRTPTVGTRRPATPSLGGSSSSIGSVGSSGGSRSGSSGGSSGGGSGGGDIGKAAVVLVVVAMLTLPFITLGLGLGRPEPSKKVATEIDKVNAYNDLARLSGSPCAAEVQP